MPNTKMKPEERSFDDIPPKEAMELATIYSTLQSDSPFDNLEQALTVIPSHITTFSKAMTMRFVESALDNDPESSRKFQELRKGTKSDALVYLIGILPFSEAVINEIDNLFEYFETLKIKELKEQFEGMLEEFKDCRQLCDTTKILHENLMVTLKKREDEAKVVTTELRELQEEYEKKQSDYEKAAALKKRVAIGFAFVPGINLIVPPALLAAANSDKKNATVQKLEAKSKENAATAISETLQPALNAFIEALGCIAGFFSEMESGIMKCQDKGERLTKEGLDSLLKVFQKNSSKIKKNCQQFRMVLPSVKANFKHICPDDETDNIEVDHKYVYENLKDMMGMTEQLRKPHNSIVDNLKRNIRRQLELANPAVESTSASCSQKASKFYV